MPFALVLIGLIMVVTGARNTHAALGQQLRADFTGPGNFFYWIAAIGAVGALGAIPNMRGFSRLFMTLIIISLLLSHRGFFTQFQQALATGPVAPARPGENGEETSGSRLWDIVTFSPAGFFARQADKAFQARKEGEARANQDLDRARGNFGAVMRGLFSFL